MSDDVRRAPSLGQSLIPVIALVGLLACSVYLYGDGSSSGSNQIALILGAGIAILVGLRLGYRWKELEAGMVHGISLAMGAILILMVVGSLIGTWILAGTVPTMIYYGLMVLTPSVFYPAACAICAVVALATGSSWTTASTIGIALIGIATAQELNLGLAAGAIISGAYFGDKMSPLSDTTNLAPAVTGTELFIHIRHMVWTTTPSLAIALVLFTIFGFVGTQAEATSDLDVFLGTLQNQFTLGLHLLLPAVLVLFLIVRRMPAFPALLLGALAGGIFAVLFQQDAILNFVGRPDLPRPVALAQGFWTAMFDGFTLESGNPALDDLLTRGGMASMLNTIWLIMSAMVFGAVMETTKMLQRLAAAILTFAHSSGSLIAATLVTAFGMNVLASDQYIAIVLPGRMFRAEYKKRGLKAKNLSRALEDSGTLTSVLVPWNTCGAFMSQTLGVATFAYAPFCFFNLLNPIISAIYGFTGFTIEKLPAEVASDESAA